MRARRRKREVNGTYVTCLRHPSIMLVLQVLAALLFLTGGHATPRTETVFDDLASSWSSMVERYQKATNSLLFPDDLVLVMQQHSESDVLNSLGRPQDPAEPPKTDGEEVLVFLEKELESIDEGADGSARLRRHLRDVRDEHDGEDTSTTEEPDATTKDLMFGDVNVSGVKEHEASEVLHSIVHGLLQMDTPPPTVDAPATSKPDDVTGPTPGWVVKNATRRVEVVHMVPIDASKRLSADVQTPRTPTPEQGGTEKGGDRQGAPVISRLISPEDIHLIKMEGRMPGAGARSDKEDQSEETQHPNINHEKKFHSVHGKNDKNWDKTPSNNEPVPIVPPLKEEPLKAEDEDPISFKFPYPVGDMLGDQDLFNINVTIDDEITASPSHTSANVHHKLDEIVPTSDQGLTKLPENSDLSNGLRDGESSGKDSRADTSSHQSVEGYGRNQEVNLSADQTPHSDNSEQRSSTTPLSVDSPPSDSNQPPTSPTSGKKKKKKKKKGLKLPFLVTTTTKAPWPRSLASLAPFLPLPEITRPSETQISKPIQPSRYRPFKGPMPLPIPLSSRWGPVNKYEYEVVTLPPLPHDGPVRQVPFGPPPPMSRGYPGGMSSNVYGVPVDSMNQPPHMYHYTMYQSPNQQLSMAPAEEMMYQDLGYQDKYQNPSFQGGYQMPAYQAPLNQEPVYQKPVYQEPLYQEPIYQEPVHQKPVYQEPVYQEPVYQEPVYQEPVYQEPIYQEPTYRKHIYQEPANQDPMYQEAVYQAPLYPSSVTRTGWNRRRRRAVETLDAATQTEQDLTSAAKGFGKVVAAPASAETLKATPHHKKDLSATDIKVEPAGNILDTVESQVIPEEVHKQENPKTEEPSSFSKMKTTPKHQKEAISLDKPELENPKTEAIPQLEPTKEKLETEKLETEKLPAIPQLESTKENLEREKLPAIPQLESTKENVETEKPPAMHRVEPNRENLETAEQSPAIPQIKPIEDTPTAVELPTRPQLTPPGPGNILGTSQIPAQPEETAQVGFHSIPPEVIDTPKTESLPTDSKLTPPVLGNILGTPQMPAKPEETAQVGFQFIPSEVIDTPKTESLPTDSKLTPPVLGNILGTPQMPAKPEETAQVRFQFIPSEVIDTPKTAALPAIPQLMPLGPHPGTPQLPANPEKTGWVGIQYIPSEVEILPKSDAVALQMQNPAASQTGNAAGRLTNRPGISPLEADDGDATQLARSIRQGAATAVTAATCAETGGVFDSNPVQAVDDNALLAYPAMGIMHRPRHPPQLPPAFEDLIPKSGESEAEKAEREQKAVQRMIQVVNVLGSLQNFLSDRARTLVRRLSKIVDDEEDPNKLR